MAKRRDYIVIGTIELPEEEDRLITGMIAEADKEIEEISVSFPWDFEKFKDA